MVQIMENGMKLRKHFFKTFFHISKLTPAWPENQTVIWDGKTSKVQRNAFLISGDGDGNRQTFVIKPWDSVRTTSYLSPISGPSTPPGGPRRNYSCPSILRGHHVSKQSLKYFHVIIK